MVREKDSRPKRVNECIAEQMEQLRAGLSVGFTAYQLAFTHNWAYSTTKKYAARVRKPDVCVYSSGVGMCVHKPVAGWPMCV